MARRRKQDVDGQMELSFDEADGGVAVLTVEDENATELLVMEDDMGDEEIPSMKKKATSAAKKKAVKKTSSKKTVAKKASGKRSTRAAKNAGAREGDGIAEVLGAKQREISVSEFFAKNRHLLGFDNPRKALLTTVKEAVDNSLDACEEAGILPEVQVGIEQVTENRYKVWVQDNGPGIVKSQIPNIFGRLLYGSKFHTLRMSRGQQGIGISAAGMYGLITTGKSVQITSRTGPRAQTHYYELQIDTKKNRPEIIKDEIVEWDARSGTRVLIEMEAKYQKGRQGVDEYLRQTAIVNPHARIVFHAPDGSQQVFERSVDEPVVAPKPVKPHPYGVELGILIKMAKDAPVRTMTAFLTDEFSRVSAKVSQEILDKAKLSARKNPHTLSHHDAEKLHAAINETKIMAPSTQCVKPIGDEALEQGLRQVVEADFYTACTRPPSVYRGNPFQIEVALSYGGGNGGEEESLLIEEEIDEKARKNGDDQQMMRVLRFANRVPLQYQQSACASFQSIVQTNWRLYGLSQSKGAVPAGPITAIVHIASVWVPFTSESKEAVAHYPEIIKEVKLALAECGRKLGRYLRGKKREREEALKRSYIDKYLPAIGEALRDILTLKEPQVKSVLGNLEVVLEKTRGKKNAS